MQGLELHLFGPPSLWPSPATGAPYTLSPKLLALLAYLCLEPGPHSREELATLLWGESSDAHARASLRQAVAALRRSLPDAVHITRADLAVAELVRCDAVDFCQLASKDSRSALEYDVPKFWCGRTLHHAPGFDEWVATRRLHLLHEYHRLLGVLCREAMSRWRWREAVLFAEQWQSSDPLNEDAVRIGVEALYLCGERGSALTRYREYMERLSRETGAQPTAPMLELVGRIEAERANRPSAPLSAEWNIRSPSFEATLVGRDDAWRTLRHAWARARKGPARVVLLEGDEGVGKSRLAEEFVRWTVAEGATLLRGRGYDADVRIPFGPLAEALQGVLAAPGLAGTAPEWLSEASRILPALRERFPNIQEPPPPEDTAGRWRLFEGIAQVILALAVERPVVLFVDDLHWCDEDSCALLHFFLRRLEKAPVLLIATVTLGSIEREAPAGRLVRVIRGQRGARVIPLAPLTEEQLWLLIREMGHVSTPDGAKRFAARMHEVTAGNPFYVIELLKTLFARGFLAMDPVQGSWTVAAGDPFDGSAKLPLPPSVSDAIAERVERLPYQLRDLLITVSVAGMPCRPEALALVHGIARLQVAALADALVERRLLVEEAGCYSCPHPLVATVVRRGLTDARRAEVHRALAVALEAATGPEDLPGLARELARHADRGGDRGRAYRWGLVASQAAVQRFAFSEALAWLDLAAEAASRGPEMEEVDRLTRDVLARAEWSEPPESVHRPATPTRGFVLDDLDLPPPTTQLLDRPERS